MVKLKVKAYSLLESVVAISIITICVGLGTTIYSNVISSEKPLITYDANEEIKRLFNELKTSRHYFNKSVDFELYSIEQGINFYKGNQLVYLVEYKVMFNNKNIATQKFLLGNEETEGEI